MENQNSIGKLADSLSKAQAKFKVPQKTQSVTYSGRTFKYADLADVIDATREGLSSNGLALTQIIDTDEHKGFGLYTSLLHSGGEKITCFYPLPDPSKVKAQEFGAALTYARRYSLSSITGVASEDDTDGDTAPPSDKKPTFPPKPQTFPQSNVPQRTSVTGVVHQMHKAPAPKPVTPTPPMKPTDPEYFDGVPEFKHPDDDLDAALDRPMMSLQEQLFKLVDDRKIPIDEVKRIIKQLCGGIQKKTDEMTDHELDLVIQYIKLLKK